jgi:hypothetical protein
MPVCIIGDIPGTIILLENMDYQPYSFNWQIFRVGNYIITEIIAWI